MNDLNTVLEALKRSLRKHKAYVGICNGDKELTEAIIPMVKEAISTLTAHMQRDSKCQCINVDVGSYDNQVTLVVPDNITLFKNTPDREKRETVCVDTCLVGEISDLWKRGIRTTGCCCGHGKDAGYIGVVDEDIEKMKELGYVVRHNPCDAGREDSFYPKSLQS